MEYVNKAFTERINATIENRQLIEEMKRDVDAFLPKFNDSPDRLSRWGHHYFCDKDGGRLRFDPESPKKHQCVVCGKVYESDVLDGTWLTCYRNRAVILTLVSAVVFKATGERKYFDYAVNVIDFYARHYHEFKLHNKENVICESYDDMVWGCGKIMPQALNEAIVGIRFVQTIEILRDQLDPEWLEMVYHKMFREMFRLMKPQVVEIHNISCWDIAAIGVIGLAFYDTEMIDFAFKSKFNIHEQLAKGVTEDSFWYEGSIHYNFFLLEGVSYLFLFSKLYDYDFGEQSTKILESMFVKAYEYAFDNQYLPDPNDGWPNLNLKTFSYIYHTVARAFGEHSAVGNITKLIERAPEARTTLPLSEPYYCHNAVCLEQLLFNIDFDYDDFEPVAHRSYNYQKSNFAMLRDQDWNVFMKYGLNGKSHAHPDLMTVEMMFDNHRVTRDLSNAGYQSRLCNEWHRKTIAHNTVCLNGEDITSCSPGKCIEFTEHKISALAQNVYEGVDYQRTIQVEDNAVTDLFEVFGKKGTCDYFFHLEPDYELMSDLDLEDSNLGFDKNGYQHILETKRVLNCPEMVKLKAFSPAVSLEIEVKVQTNQELYLLKTMDNPVNLTRTTIMLRSKDQNPCYHLKIKNIK